MIIYKISNSVTHKCYIGQTTNKNPRDRWSQHRSKLRKNIHYNNKLQNSWNKYGEIVWSFDIIATANSLDELNELEIKLIAEHNSVDNGYNLTSGGRNYRHTEETKEKLRQVNLGKFTGELNPMFGKTHSPKTRKLISERRTGILKGIPLSDSTKQKISKANTGKIRTQEMRKKISDSMSGNKNPLFGKRRPIHSKLMSGINNPRFGIKMSDELKQKISIAVKQQIKDKKSNE